MKISIVDLVEKTNTAFYVSNEKTGLYLPCSGNLKTLYKLGNDGCNATL